MGVLRMRLILGVIGLVLGLAGAASAAGTHTNKNHSADDYQTESSVILTGGDFGVAENPSGAAMGADALLARPLGLASSVLGTGLFVVSLPFTTFSGSVGSARESLIDRPLRFTFTRPLGSFDSQD